MMRSILIAAILLTSLSCDQQEKSMVKKEMVETNSFSEESGLYGEYFLLADISLELTPPNKFALNKFGIHDNTIMSYAFGRFKVKDDIIILMDLLTEKEFALERQSEELLIVIKCDKVAAGDRFLCNTKFYANGNMKFTGDWKDNKKDGVWRFLMRLALKPLFL